jgi:hypothetical protein
MALPILSCGRPIITSDLPLFRELQDYFGKLGCELQVIMILMIALLIVQQKMILTFLICKLNEISLSKIAHQHKAAIQRITEEMMIYKKNSRKMQNH